MIETREILRRAKESAPWLRTANEEIKNRILRSMALRLTEATPLILTANAEDLAAAKGSVSDVMLDRLALTESRIAAMAQGILDVADLPDPVGKILQTTERPNGLIIEKVSVPLGVVAVIYESRPNVASDAASLTLKAGNACILRGGKEAHRTCLAVTDALRNGLKDNNAPQDLIQTVWDTSRESANELMNAVGFVDLLIPRGGAGLIRACVEHAKVPCIQTGTGICHIYVDESADFEKALNIIENAKTSRPSVCNAEEVLLVHRSIAPTFLPLLHRRLRTEREENGAQPVEFRLDAESSEFIPGTPASSTDFDTEFLDYILAVAVVESVDEAIEHIARHSTGHSEAIITENTEHAERFLNEVDSAAVYHNASTRFTDGGEFGLGCEIGISTQKLHARGPMGLNEMTTYKYIVRGNGQTR